MQRHVIEAQIEALKSVQAELDRIDRDIFNANSMITTAIWHLKKTLKETET